MPGIRRTLVPGGRPVPQTASRCIDVLAERGIIDPGALGYWGISMGAALGIALLADAARIRRPVLFLLQWDDERVPRAEAFDLFDAIASPDKRLHAYPGGHGETPQEAIGASERFLAAHLTSGELDD